MPCQFLPRLHSATLDHTPGNSRDPKGIRDPKEGVYMPHRWSTTDLCKRSLFSWYVRGTEIFLENHSPSAIIPSFPSLTRKNGGRSDEIFIPSYTARRRWG